MDIDPKSKIVIYAPEAFSSESRKKYPLRAKTADGIIRFSNYEILGVYDFTAHDGENCKNILGIREDIKVFSSMQDILSLNPKYLFIGVSPEGGNISSYMLEDIKMALKSGISIVSGMHFEMSQDATLSSIAKENGASLYDVRIPKEDIPVASAKAYFSKSKRILTVGMDAAIGKMTVCIALDNYARKLGRNSAFIATGQTGIMISGRGISVDRVIGDFMAGAAEKLVLEYSDKGYDPLFVEGQGSLFHPGYSGVTLSLMHGAVPTDLILVVRAKRKHSIGSKLIALPEIVDAIRIHEDICLPIQKAKVRCIAVNSYGMDDVSAREYISKVEDITGLPTDDVLLNGPERLYNALKL